MPERTCYEGFRKGSVIELFEDPVDGYRWGEVVFPRGDDKVSHLQSYNCMEEEVISGWEQYGYVQAGLLLLAHTPWAESAAYEQFLD